MDLCSTFCSTFDASAFFKVVPFPGGEADAALAKTMVNAAVNKVAMLLVFITWFMG